MDHNCFVIFGPNEALATWASLGSHLFCLGQKNAYGAGSLPEVAHIRMLSGKRLLGLGEGIPSNKCHFQTIFNYILCSFIFFPLAVCCIPISDGRHVCCSYTCRTICMWCLGVINLPYFPIRFDSDYWRLLIFHLTSVSRRIILLLFWVTPHSTFNIV